MLQDGEKSHPEFQGDWVLSRKVGAPEHSWIEKHQQEEKKGKRKKWDSRDV